MTDLGIWVTDNEFDDNVIAEAAAPCCKRTENECAGDSGFRESL